MGDRIQCLVCGEWTLPDGSVVDKDRRELSDDGYSSKHDGDLEAENARLRSRVKELESR